MNHATKLHDNTVQDLICDIPEPFNSRGIGQDWGLPCFVCGVDDGLSKNISGFVRTAASGAHVVHLFSGRARLDYRETEPEWIQVKVGCCEKHSSNLESLHRLSADKGTICAADIATLKAVEAKS